MSAENLQAYPYYDQAGARHSSSLNPSVAEQIGNLKGPIVEIGGPSQFGYNFLQDDRVLPSKPIVTNVADGVWQKNQVDTRADLRNLPFADESVSMFLASHINLHDYKGQGDVFKLTTAQHSRMMYLAESEYGLATADPSYATAFNLRIALLQEAARAATPGGFLIFESIGSRDVKIARKVGWEVVQATSRNLEWEEPTVDAVFQKRGR